MSKQLKQGTYTFLLITHVKGVKGYFNLQPLQHVLTYITFDSMVGKSQVSAFQNFFQIENWLNIKKVMSKDVMSPYSIF